MPAKPKALPTRRTTLYRLQDVDDLLDALAPDKRAVGKGIMAVEACTVGTLSGLLAAGSSAGHSGWPAHVQALTAKTVDANIVQSGAVLLLKDGEAVWALSWGSGFRFLDHDKIDYGFGTRVLARSALPREIKSITKTILDHRARVDRSSLPNGSTIRDLGVDGYGEVVSRVEAKARIDGLTVGAKDIQLRAADSLNLPLGEAPAALVADLKSLGALLTKTVLPGLESIEQLVALKRKDPAVAALEEKLATALQLPDDGRLGMSWPHERLELHGPVACCRITGIGDHKRHIYEEPPTIEDVRGWLSDAKPDDLMDRIRAIRLQLHSDAEATSASAISRPVSLRRWLSFEVLEGARRYCFHDGAWYRMDEKYLERIDERVKEILGDASSIALPAWPDGIDERAYNLQTAPAIGGYTLDRKLIQTPLHAQGGIEPCDLYVHPGVLLHVKRGRSSAELSHLLAQALVSTDALARDENGRAAWAERVKEVSSGAVTDASISEVILAIGRPNPITVDNLFTFTKVNLVKQYDALRFLDVKVRVQQIPE
jgi:uncharacterized protein (TIGR04141 family)